MKFRNVLFILILCCASIIMFMSTLTDMIKTSSQILSAQDEEGFVKYRLIKPKRLSTVRGSIFIFPPTGGENIIDRLYGRQLASLGYEVFILQSWTHIDLDGVDYDLHNVFYGSAQAALNKLLPLAQSSKMGILGTSVGALHSSVALTLNDKIRTGFLIVGGLPIPEVIVRSEQEAMKTLKQRRYQKYKLQDDAQYLKQLSDIFKYEPTTYTAPTKSVGAVISENDALVPYETQMSVIRFFKASPVYTTSLSHIQTVIWNGIFHRKRVSKFFLEHL